MTAVMQLCENRIYFCKLFLMTMRLLSFLSLRDLRPVCHICCKQEIIHSVWMRVQNDLLFHILLSFHFPALYKYITHYELIMNQNLTHLPIRLEWIFKHTNSLVLNLFGSLSVSIVQQHQTSALSNITILNRKTYKTL